MKKLMRMISFVLLLSACTLSLMNGVSGTLAYRSSSTESVVNSFRPTYDPVSDTAYITLTAHKTVENIGEESIGPEGFTFLLDDLQTGVSTAKESDKKGLAIFTLSFTEEHVGKIFRYQLYEKKGDRGGVIYSDQVYNMEISVEKVDGKVVPHILLNDIETAIAPFRNVYNSQEDPEIPDTGDHAQPLLYAGMMLTGGIGCVLLRPYRKRK